jgi:hypothetical protein
MVASLLNIGPVHIRRWREGSLRFKASLLSAHTFLPKAKSRVSSVAVFMNGGTL